MEDSIYNKVSVVTLLLKIRLRLHGTIPAWQAVQCPPPRLLNRQVMASTTLDCHVGPHITLPDTSAQRGISLLFHNGHIAH